MSLPTFVINLDRRPDRLSIQTAQLEQLGIVWERIAAVDADSIPDAEYNRRKYHWERKLHRPEVGCFLSHQIAWQRIADRSTAGLVLEDDSLLSRHAASVLQQFSFAQAAACYNLEAGFARKTVSRKPTGEPIEGHQAFRVYYDRGGSGAYVMTPAAARIALRLAQQHTAPADAFLNTLPGVARYQFEPTLSLQLVHCHWLANEFDQTAAASNIIRPRRRFPLLEAWQHQPLLKFRRLQGYCRRTATKLCSWPHTETRQIRFCESIDRMPHSG